MWSATGSVAVPGPPPVSTYTRSKTRSASSVRNSRATKYRGPEQGERHVSRTGPTAPAPSACAASYSLSSMLCSPAKSRSTATNGVVFHTSARIERHPGRGRIGEPHERTVRRGRARSPPAARDRPAARRGSATRARSRRWAWPRGGAPPCARSSYRVPAPIESEREGQPQPELERHRPRPRTPPFVPPPPGNRRVVGAPSA